MNKSLCSIQLSTSFKHMCFYTFYKTHNRILCFISLKEKKMMFKKLHVINIKTLKALTKSKILKAMFRYFE